MYNELAVPLYAGEEFQRASLRAMLRFVASDATEAASREATRRSWQRQWIAARTVLAGKGTRHETVRVSNWRSLVEWAGRRGGGVGSHLVSVKSHREHLAATPDSSVEQGVQLA